MAIEIQAPKSFSKYFSHNYITIFAGGSIEMDMAKPWQRRLVSAFKDYDDVVIINPRRTSWNNSWKQVAKDKNFRKQVEWELTGLEDCDLAIMYFDPATKSPISLLELGLFGTRSRWNPDTKKTLSKMHVVCPAPFWRKGNVDIVCERYDIPAFKTLGAAVKAIKLKLEYFRRWEPPMSKGILR
jgi:hypothetical protein